MLSTRLILFDGLPGSGKSTQARWLETELQAQNYPAQWYEEGDHDHPLNWFEQWWQPDFDLAPYLDNLPGSMLRSLQRWQDFADEAAQSDTITILDSWPFLNSVGMFLQGNALHESLQDYARQVQAMIEPLSPTLTYLHQPDPRHALRRILDIRDPAFERELFHNMSRFPFCCSRDLHDFECVVTLWRANQRLMRDLLPGFAPYQMVIDTTAHSWEDCRQQILDLIAL